MPQEHDRNDPRLSIEHSRRPECPEDDEAEDWDGDDPPVCPECRVYPMEFINGRWAICAGCEAYLDHITVYE